MHAPRVPCLFARTHVIYGVVAGIYFVVQTDVWWCHAQVIYLMVHKMSMDVVPHKLSQQAQATPLTRTHTFGHSSCGLLLNTILFLNISTAGNI